MAQDLTLIMRRCLERYRLFNSDEPLVLAVSTGLDSMCLLDSAQNIIPASRLVVAHVNHHLRAQSQVEEKFLRKYCQQKHLRLAVDQWTDHPQHGIEAAARHERYQFFEQVMKECGSRVLLLAHQKDELAENMMMQLLRGGRLDQLIGIPTMRPFAGRGIILRPFLTVGKQELLEYAKSHHIRWYEDDSNQADETLRNRFRHHYLPALERENPRFKDHLLDYRQQLMENEDVLADLMKPVMDRVLKKSSLNLASYRQYQPAIRREILRRWFAQEQVFNLDNDRLRQFDDWLLNPQKASGENQITRNAFLLKDYQQARVSKRPSAAVSAFTNDQNVVKSELILNQWQLSHHGQVFGVFTYMPKAAKLAACLYLRADQLPLRWSLGQTAGYLSLKNGGHQSVHRVMINQKIPRSQRAAWPLLLDQQGHVLWIVGLKTTWLDRPVTDEGINRVYLCEKLKLEETHG